MNWLTTDNQVAIVAIAVSVLTALLTGMAQAWINWRRAEIESWRRLVELAQILHAGPTYGYWAQIVAVHELKTNRRRKLEVIEILTSAHGEWSGKDRPQLLSAINEALDTLGAARGNALNER